MKERNKLGQKQTVENTLVMRMPWHLNMFLSILHTASIKLFCCYIMCAETNSCYGLQQFFFTADLLLILWEAAGEEE